MISLDHLLLDNRVLTQEFACDVARCKGACCTLPGGAGAPLLAEEVEHVQRAVSAAEPYLSERSREYIRLYGATEEVFGGWATRCIDDADCVFVTYEGDVATCAIEKAWHNGETLFRKPISCHLFPIRVANFGGPYVHYEEFSECKPGRERGAREGMLLVDSVREALERAFGADVTHRLISMAHELRQQRGAR